MEEPLVSVIIPTYNRAHLIGETLDSILAQTFQNWECLVIDDRSSDDTDSLLGQYSREDKRIKYSIRPKGTAKGANTCRNIGIEKATGDYIVFFDSDDLMTPDHLEVKVEGILGTEWDYVITRTKFFNKDSNAIDNNYAFHKYELNPYNYISQKINWLTYDICIKKELAQKINFNNRLRSGQEYNYFCKLVHLSTNAKFIDKVVTLRRYHENSIQGGLTGALRSERRTLVHFWTYMDVKDFCTKEVKEILLLRSADTIQDVPFQNIPTSFWIYQLKEFGMNSMNLIFYYITYKLFRKGYCFREQFFKGFKKHEY